MSEAVQGQARRGRPPKAKAADAAPVAKVAPQHKMKAKPNWDEIEPDTFIDESPDRLRIDRDLIPEGMDMQWVTDTVYGQPMPQHRADFERRGWTPVHQEDFEGQFNGMWMPKDAAGEIKVDGLVLMARPLELSIKAKKLDRRRALEQVQIKEAELTGGNLPGVTLDAQHPNAVKSNRINKSLDGAFVPAPKD